MGRHGRWVRHSIIFRWWNHQGGRAFHNNFWPNLELDPSTGRFVEKENLLPTREALYQMTDPQRMVDLLQDDLALQLFAFKAGLIRELDHPAVTALAARLEFPFDWSQESKLRSQAGNLLDRYSLRATRWVLEKARDFDRQNGKELLALRSLTYSFSIFHCGMRPGVHGAPAASSLDSSIGRSCSARVR